MFNRCSLRGAAARRKMPFLLTTASLSALCGLSQAQAAPSFTNPCSGLGVSLPHLTPATAGSTLTGLVPAIGDLVSSVNTNLTTALDSKVLTVGALDPATNTVIAIPAGACNLALNGLKVDNPNGITVGGGQILGLGGTGGVAASAGDPSAIAFGNGATTATGIPNALALGTGATATVGNSVALGAGSTAGRGAGSVTAFGLHGTQASGGEVSIGGNGVVRQLTNLAPGSADTDAVNLLQLRGATASVGTAASAALGGGALYNAVNATITLPSFHIRGTTYTNVGAALDAVDIALTNQTTVNNPPGTTPVSTATPHDAVLYDHASNGSTLSSITLNSDQGGPVVIHNLAAGTANSDAATVGQVQAVANNSVQYEVTNGVKSNTVMLSGGSPGGVTISNLAPGVQGTDAVNLNQLRGYTSGLVQQANAYTDGAVSNLRALTDREIGSARRDAAGGTALALAATGLRYDDRPGKFSVGGATAYYNGQMGLALGLGATSETGRVRLNAALSASPTMDHPDIGGVVGASISLN